MLSRLASEGVRFDAADSTVPLTLPSHATLLSGLLPLHHGVRNNGAGAFPADRDTLATLLARSGYRTGAFVGSFILDHRFGLARGFDRYDDEIRRSADEAAGSFEAERRGGEVVDRALAWLKQSDARPFFAWVHLYDAHAPYAPPAPYAQTYDGEIEYVDAQVARLLAAIDRTRTIVVIVGDHGESLGEHGEVTHGLLLYESTLHVPLIIAAPSLRPRVVREPVSTVDVAPTVADLAGLKFPGKIDGVRASRPQPPDVSSGGETRSGETPDRSGRDARTPRSIAIQFRYAFVANGDGLHVVDITDPTHPTLAATVAIADARNVYVARTYAYVAAGAQGLVIVDVERPDKPRIDQTVTEGLKDVNDVKVASTNASVFAYVADSEGLKILQLTSPEWTPTYAGFSPRPAPRLIARRRTAGPALAISKGLDRDRAVDESGNQVSIFNRLGARPMTLLEMQRLYLRDGKVYTVP